MPAPRRDRHPLAALRRACAATLKDPLAQGRAPRQTPGTPGARVPVDPRNTKRPAAPHQTRS